MSLSGEKRFRELGCEMLVYRVDFITPFKVYV